MQGCGGRWEAVWSPLRLLFLGSRGAPLPAQPPPLWALPHVALSSCKMGTVDPFEPPCGSASIAWDPNLRVKALSLNQSGHWAGQLGHCPPRPVTGRSRCAMHGGWRVARAPHPCEGIPLSGESLNHDPASMICVEQISKGREGIEGERRMAVNHATVRDKAVGRRSH